MAGTLSSGGRRRGGIVGINVTPMVDVVLVLLVSTGVDERFFVEMARAGVLVNLVMWAFNLFPLPPLDGGRILVGLQVPKADTKAIKPFLDKLGYAYVDETRNPVYRLFLR